MIPENELAAVILALAAFCTALATLVTAIRAVKKVDTLHTLVNSRLTQLLATTETAALARGKLSAGGGDASGRTPTGKDAPDA